MSVIPDTERLIELDKIYRLKARRDRAVDTKDWDTYEALHVPEHVSHNDGFPRWTGAKEMIENVKRLMADVVSVHHSHTPQIDFITPEKATGIWAMEDNIYWKQGDENHWLRGFGYYHETYEKRGGQWLFTSRQLKRLHVQTSPGALFGEDRAAFNQGRDAKQAGNE